MFKVGVTEQECILLLLQMSQAQSLKNGLVRIDRVFVAYLVARGPWSRIPSQSAGHDTSCLSSEGWSFPLDIVRVMSTSRISLMQFARVLLQPCACRMCEVKSGSWRKRNCCTNLQFLLHQISFWKHESWESHFLARLFLIESTDFGIGFLSSLRVIRGTRWAWCFDKLRILHLISTWKASKLESRTSFKIQFSHPLRQVGITQALRMAFPERGLTSPQRDPLHLWRKSTF